MTAPTLTSRTDASRHLVHLAVAGPLTSADHGAALTQACTVAPDGYGLVVNLSAVSAITDAGMRVLRGLAADVAAAGRRIAFVCTELLLRSELVLADLDRLAPIVHADEQAEPLVGYAA